MSRQSSFNADQPLTSHLKTDQVRAERRAWPRTPVEQAVTVMFNEYGERLGVMRLEIVDTSLTGLGARCSKPLTPGVRVQITTPSSHIACRSARVVRCVQQGDEYSVGLRLERSLSTAA